MSLTDRALLPIFIFTVTVIGFNQRANSQSKSLCAIDPQNFNFISNRSAPWLAQTPPPLQLTESSEVPDAETLLLQALEVANSLKDSYRQATLLKDIAIKYANLGKIDRAREILAQSLEVAKTIEDIGNKVTIMAAIAQNYAEIGQLTTAQGILSETTEIANSVEDKSLQAALLSQIALKYADINQEYQTKTLLSQSQEILKQESLPVADFPFQPTPLQGRFTVGGEISTSTNNESELSAQLKLEKHWETDQFLFNIDFKTDFDNSRSSNQYRTKIFSVGYYSHHFDETWQVLTLGRFERDIEDGIFYDTELVVGPGINIFRQGSERSLDIGVGLGVRYQDALGKPDDTKCPTVGLLLSYKDLFFEFLKFNTNFLISVPVSDSVDSRFSSTSELSIPLWESWFFTTQARYIYRGIPATRRSGSEFDFTTGLSYEF